MQPLHSPLGQPEVSGDMEALQTDVMRFLAILCLCLVSLSTLMIPEESQAPPEAQPSPEPVSDSPMPEAPAAEAPAEEGAPSPRDERLPEPDLNPRREAQSESEAAEDPVGPSAALERPLPGTPEREGFALSFASQDALRALVRKRQVGIYAIVGRELWHFDPATRSFVSNAPDVPAYLLQRDDLPAEIAHRLPKAQDEELYIGVLLPAQTVNELQDLMSKHRGGDLIIDADGRARRLDDESSGALQ